MDSVLICRRADSGLAAAFVKKFQSFLVGHNAHVDRVGDHIRHILYPACEKESCTCIGRQELDDEVEFWIVKIIVNQQKRIIPRAEGE